MDVMTTKGGQGKKKSDSQIASIRALIRCQSLIETQQFFLPQALIEIMNNTFQGYYRAIITGLLLVTHL
jgi:hypothetical protein